MAQGVGGCHPDTLIWTCHRQRCTQRPRGLIDGEGQYMVSAGGVEKLGSGWTTVAATRWGD